MTLGLSSGLNVGATNAGAGGGGGGGGASFDITGTEIFWSGAVTRTYNDGVQYRGADLGFPGVATKPPFSVTVTRNQDTGGDQDLRTRFVVPDGNTDRYYLIEQANIVTFANGALETEHARDFARIAMAQIWWTDQSPPAPLYNTEGINKSISVDESVTVQLNLTNSLNSVVYDSIQIPVTITGSALMKDTSGNVYAYAGSYGDYTLHHDN